MRSGGVAPPSLVFRSAGVTLADRGRSGSWPAIDPAAKVAADASTVGPVIAGGDDQRSRDALSNCA